MPNYRRAFAPGASWFFTVNLLQRRRNDLLLRHVELLRDVVRRVHRDYPFTIDAWVVLPEHMHCVWTLPPGDADYPLRWRLIKTFFCRGLPSDEYRSLTRLRRGERGIWQRRYWEHQLRDDEDFRRHIDYVYINPCKHGLVGRVADWPHSSFHRDVVMGLYPVDWAGDIGLEVPGMGRGQGGRSASFGALRLRLMRPTVMAYACASRLSTSATHWLMLLCSSSAFTATVACSSGPRRRLSLPE